MAASEIAGERPSGRVMSIELDLTLLSTEAILKTCHWFSRDFACDLRKNGDTAAEVRLIPRNPASPFDPHAVGDAFVTSAMDFSLREKIDAKTSGIRDLLLAKAFSESGVLEDKPEGVFGDAVEEAKPDGMFKILNASQS